ncbi:acetyl-CoA carboxylase biotin carboxyl carrier protein [Rhizobium puerariae]|uniref:Biotin carboxyl carrier protein of acetyl-CoA carboxylase n=1 Tax=Rhizobium puerariae TaxID=1585791 RepID=A0ABV6AG18_9HYPH
MDLEKIKKLIEFVGASRISELAVTEDGVTVRILREDGPAAPSQGAPLAQASEPVSAPEDTGPPPPAAPAKSRIVTAPSFGLFHRAPSPGAPPFVDVGDQIAEGQELFIIEAMKVFSTVKAERGGRVVRILADDGEDVELGQPVLELE